MEQNNEETAKVRSQDTFAITYIDRGDDKKFRLNLINLTLCHLFLLTACFLYENHDVQGECKTTDKCFKCRNDPSKAIGSNVTVAESGKGNHTKIDGGTKTSYVGIQIIVR